jgi:hypothetical protein
MHVSRVADKGNNGKYLPNKEFIVIEDIIRHCELHLIGGDGWVEYGEQCNPVCAICN